MSRIAVRNARNVAKFVWTHPANRCGRMSALVRAGIFQLRGRLLHQRTLAQLGSRSAIWVDLHRTAGSKVVYANPPDYPEMLVWQTFLRPGDLFVDVGANVGTYAIWAGELGAQVIALEPAPDTCALLDENVRMNGYDVQVIQAAAASSPGTATFTSGRDCLNRFDSSGEAAVTTVRLDDVIGTRTVKGMKVDVEGFELEVLKGCVEALSTGRIDLLQLEWNEASEEAVGNDRRPLAQFLGQYGYRLYRPDFRGQLLVLADVPSSGGDVFARRCSSIERN